MNFSLENSISILERTPAILNTYLRGLPDGWTMSNEGGETWSPYDIVGHLIHGEKTDWVVRARIILSDAEDKSFEPFDRFAQLSDSKGKSLDALLDEFEVLRCENIKALKSLDISEAALDLTGEHPEFKTVTLRQLLSTWTVHDMGHIYQISRVMAFQYKDSVGPWTKYLKVLP